MSNGKKQSQYTAEFRESAVKLAVESEQSVTKVAEELGVNANTLHTWISKYHAERKPKGGQLQDEHLYEELKRLRRDVKLLTEERDILKKAATYFAKESL